MKLVTVTPAGRRRYLKALVPYLLRNRDVVREHRWWVNTRDPGDLAYLHRLVDEHPDFFRLVVEPIDPSLRVGEQIWRYMRACDEPDTVYVRLDDDICYVEDGAIAAMYEHRLAHPNPFMVLGTIVNNAICTHLLQKAGVVPRAWGEVAEECMDDTGWRDPRFARRLHRAFLADLAAGRTDRWRGHDMAFDGVRRFSVNAICWRGDDMALIEDRWRDNVDEEVFLTVDAPQRLGRPNEVCPHALFGHYAFWTQRKLLEKVAPEILDAYQRIAVTGEVTATASPAEKLALAARRNSGRVFWGARAAVHGAKGIAKRLQPTPSARAASEAAPATAAARADSKAA